MTRGRNCFQRLEEHHYPYAWRWTKTIFPWETFHIWVEHWYGIDRWWDIARCFGGLKQTINILVPKVACASNVRVISWCMANKYEIKDITNVNSAHFTWPDFWSYFGFDTNLDVGFVVQTVLTVILLMMKFSCNAYTYTTNISSSNLIYRWHHCNLINTVISAHPRA